MVEPILHLKNLCRSFQQGEVTLSVLNGVNFSLYPGEIVALVGPSGSGKSTLLQLAGLLESPTRGEVWVQGLACQFLNDSKRTALRRQSIGFIYQFHHLLPEFSAKENIMLPQMMAGVSFRDAEKRALGLLESVGLTPRQNHRPTQLSGGEQQRVAITRALANKPVLLLADEPTGNLDTVTAESVFLQLMGLVRDQNLSALVATHNIELAARMDRRVSLHKGEIIPLP